MKDKLEERAIRYAYGIFCNQNACSHLPQELMSHMAEWNVKGVNGAYKEDEVEYILRGNLGECDIRQRVREVFNWNRLYSLRSN